MPYPLDETPNIQYDQLLTTVVMNIAGADGSQRSFKSIITAEPMTLEQEHSVVHALDVLTDSRGTEGLIACNAVEAMFDLLPIAKNDETKEVIYERFYDFAREGSVGQGQEKVVRLMSERILNPDEQTEKNPAITGRLNLIAVKMLESHDDAVRQDAMKAVQKHNAAMVYNFRDQHKDKKTVALENNA
jgi:hypothetical protein